MIFDSYEAARAWRPVSNSQAGAVRATYLLNRKLNQESLRLHLLRGTKNEGTLDTTLDLSRASSRRCRFEVSGRCLMAIDGPDRFDDRAMAAGRVKIRARINKAGTIENAQIVESDQAKPREVGALGTGVIAHLKSWRFEPSSQPGDFMVTYRYVVDPEIIMPTIELGSVTEVTIRANPAITGENLRRLVEKGVR